MAEFTILAYTDVFQLGYNYYSHSISYSWFCFNINYFPEVIYSIGILQLA